MKKKIKNVTWLILYLIVAVILGTLLMIGVYRLPTEKIILHVKESEDIYAFEGQRPNWTPGLKYGQLDNYTDSIMLRTAMFSDDNSAVYNAMMNPFYRTDELKSQVKCLLALLNGKKSDSMYSIGYPRYWHGYLTILKPMLQFFNVSELRMINMMLQLFLMTVVILLLGKRLGIGYGVAFGLTVGFLNPVAIAASFQYSDIYYIVLFSFLAALLFEKRLEENNLWSRLFMMTGILVAFFDFLTYPFVTLGMLLILMILLQSKSIVGNLIDIIKNSICWGIGYVGMWAGKWIISSVLTKQNLVLNAIDQVRERTGGDTSMISGGEEAKILKGIVKNVEVIWTSPMKLVLLLIGLGILLLLITGIVRFRFYINKIVPILFVCTYPFIWYIVVENHSVIHSWMAYREMAITFFGMLCMLAILFQRNTQGNCFEDKNNIL